MVSPTINRVKGKTLEQRRRDHGRMVKVNRKAAGKITKPPVRDRGPKTNKKKLKKKEQRARLLGASNANGDESKMQM
jgi:hypothetical protein